MDRKAVRTHTKRLSVAVVLAAAVLVATGCEATGGGWIHSQEGDGKAIFGFTVQCKTTETADPTEPVAASTKGELEWDDKPADLQFHADIVSPPFPGTCEDFDDETSRTFFGVYRRQPPGGMNEEGFVRLDVTDLGQAGMDEDMICVSLFVGSPAPPNAPWYTNCGTVQGGNIEFH